MSLEYSIPASHAARATLALLRPHDLIGARKIRVGHPFDGGYIMIDAFEGVEAAYSFGINDDVSWDSQIASHGIDVFQYDHTIEGLPETDPHFHWNKIGIAARSGDGMTNIDDAVASNGHSNQRNMLLKCDIEGAEWETLRRTRAATLAQFSQIVIELHDLFRVGHSIDDVHQAIANLTHSHHVVHIHANNFGGVRVVGGFSIPNVVEVTLARKDMGEFRPSELTFPTAMDMPCNGNEADIYLGNFTFS